MGSKKVSGSPDNERSGRRLKALRKLMGLKQVGLADLLAIHPSHVGQLEAGHRIMSHDLEIMLHLLTGVDREWLSGTKGDDGVPLSVVDQPLIQTTVHQRLAWDQSRDASDESQKSSIHWELLDWARVFRAAANGGKLSVAIGRSIRARLDFLKNASLGPMYANDGYLLDLRWPPGSHMESKAPEFEDYREELFSQLSAVLSPALLLEIGHALDEKPELTRYIGMLQKAMDALTAFEQVRRRYQPNPARLKRTMAHCKLYTSSPKRRPSPKSVKTRR